MKRIIVLLAILTHSNLFSQIFVGGTVHKEIVSTSKKENQIDSLNIVNLLRDYPFIHNNKREIFPKKRVQGIYLAFEKINENHQEIIYKIRYFPLDSIGENSYFLIDERNTNFNNKKKFYKRIEVLKNKILDYAIIEDSTLIRGGYLYKKWINPNIYKSLPDIILKDFNKKTISNVGFLSMNPFERTISQYNNFNYKSDIYLDGLTENSYPKMSTEDDRNGNAIYKIGFTPFTNYLPPTNENQNKYGGYIRKCESINPQNYYSIYVRYLGDEIIRKAHSIKYKKEKILFPNKYRNYKYNQKYKAINGIEIDTISNLLYETTFNINKNGMPISKIEDNIRILSFQFKDTYYSAIETIEMFYGNMRTLIEIEKICFIKFDNDSKDCKTLMNQIEHKYVDEFKRLLTEELDFTDISLELNKKRKKIQYEKLKKRSLIKPYYEKTALSFTYEFNTIYQGFSQVIGETSFNANFDFFSTVSFNSSDNEYVNDEEYDKKFKKEYINRVQKLNKQICKELNGSFKENRCECNCKTK